MDTALVQLRVEAALQRGRLAEAQSAMDRYRAAPRANPTNRELAWYNAMSGWIEALESDDGNIGDALMEAVHRYLVNLEAARRIARSLEQQDRPKSARRVWQGLSRAYPNSREVSGALARLDRQLGQIADQETVIIEIPDGAELDIDGLIAAETETVPDHLVVAMRSSRRFLTMAGEYIEGGRWADLDQLMRELRRARPAWMPAHQEEIRDIEIELNIGDKNWPALLTNVRLQIDGSMDRALDLLKLARRLDGMGERGTAERILVEIERRHPDFPPTQRMRDDWAASDPEETSSAP